MTVHDAVPPGSVQRYTRKPGTGIYTRIRTGGHTRKRPAISWTGPDQFDDAIGKGWRWSGIKAPDERRLMVEAPATVPQVRTKLQPAP